MGNLILAIGWIYQFLAHLIGQLVNPSRNIASTVFDLGTWTWNWLKATNIYTAVFRDWVVLAAKGEWDVYTKPAISILHGKVRQYAEVVVFYLDRAFYSLRLVVGASIFGTLGMVVAILGAVDLVHAGFVGARTALVKVGGYLDLTLFQLETRVADFAALTRTQLDKLATWTAAVMTVDGLLRPQLLAWSIAGAARVVWSALTDMTLFPTAEADAQALAALYKPRTPPEARIAYYNGFYHSHPFVGQAVALYAARPFGQ